MRFAFTDDQLLFRDALRELLARECPPGHVRAAWREGDERQVDATDGRARRSSVWSALAEMGVLGARVPESAGGLGLTDLDLVLLLEETGRAAVPEPVLETVAVVAPLLAACEGAESAAWLRRIATGDAVVALAMDDALVLDADICDALLVCEAGRVALIDAARLQLTRQPSVDGARHLFEVVWDGDGEVVLAEGEAADALVAEAFDRGALGAAAQLVGAAEHTLAVTVEYVKERKQFGVPVGSFQAVKHHLADATLVLEFAAPAVHRAAHSLAHGLGSASRDVSMAKAAAGDAARRVVRHALQCHGAIAYTVEYDLHLWMKRIWALASTWGDAAWHRHRVAEHVLGPAPAHWQPAPPNLVPILE